MICLLSCSSSGFASTFEDGVNAAKNGNYSKAYSIWLPLAEQGNSDAQFRIGTLYSTGEGVQQSNHEALKWYHLAAEQGNKDAEKQLKVNDNNSELAYLVFWALGIYLVLQAIISNKKNDDIDKLIESEFERQLRTGIIETNRRKNNPLILISEPIINENIKNSKKYSYDKGAEEYDKGNYSEAFKIWLSVANNENEVDAIFNLGYMYENGQGVEINLSEAFKWYMLSAKQGHSNSQYNIGMMYENGEGVSKNYIEAKKWYKLAANQGDLDAQNNIDKIIEIINHEELDEIFPEINENKDLIFKNYIDKINTDSERISKLEFEINEIRFELDNRKKQENERMHFDNEKYARIENDLKKAKELEQHILIQIELLKKMKPEFSINEDISDNNISENTKPPVNIVIDLETQKFEDMF
jgi:TPR repeat protein